MQTFDRNNVEALLTEVVRKRGEDFQYGKDSDTVACAYQVDGIPSCGIGVMLSDIGVSPEALRDLDMAASDTNIDSPAVLDILAANGFLFTEDAVKFMLAFQRWQDQEHPYANCLASAKAGHADPFGSYPSNPPF